MNPSSPINSNKRSSIDLTNLARSLPKNNKAIETNLFKTQLPAHWQNSSSSLSQKDIILLTTRDAQVPVKIKDIANLLSYSESKIIEMFKDNAFRPLLSLEIQAKILGEQHPAVQNLRFLRKQVEQALAEPDKISVKSHKIILDIFNQILTSSLPAIPARPLVNNYQITPSKNSDFAFSIQKNIRGQQFALTKHTIGSGAVKKAKLAIDLNRLLITAIGITKLPNDPDNAAYIKELLNNEAKIQGMLKGYPEFVQLIHQCSYVSKTGEEKMSLMMEYCNYGDLFDYIDKNRCQNEEEVWQIVRDIFTGLAILHEVFGIHHRDIKPENIFLIKTEDGQVRAKIGDFGYSALIHEEKLFSTYCGTERFNSPEFIAGHIEATSGRATCMKGETLIQKGLKHEGEMHIANGKRKMAEGFAKAATLKTDVWAMGILLYELRKNLLESVPVLPEASDPDKFRLEMACLDQAAVDQLFPNPGEDPLTDLIAMMLRVNPDERPSAKECLEMFKKIPHKDFFN